MASTTGRDDSGTDLEPDDVASATFSTSFRGFDPGEVRAYLSRIAGELRASQRRMKTLSQQLDDLEVGGEQVTEASPADSAIVEQQRMTEVLGAEAARVLSTAHDAAGDIRARAEREAEEIRSAAKEDASVMVADAETRATEIVANADRLLVERSEEADASAAEIVAQAEAEREEMRQEGRHMVSEARIVRQRILKDMAKRRNQGRVQLEQLRAGRDRLQESYTVVRRTLEEVTVELTNVVDDARIAADRAGRQVDVDEIPSDESLEAEVAVARDAGLTVPPAEPRIDGETTNEFDRRLLAEAAQDTIDDDTDDEAPVSVADVPEIDASEIDGVATGDVFGSETPEDGVDFRTQTDQDGRAFEGVRILGPAVRPLPGTVTGGVRPPTDEPDEADAHDGAEDDSATDEGDDVEVDDVTEVVEVAEAAESTQPPDLDSAEFDTAELDTAELDDADLDDAPAWRDELDSEAREDGADDVDSDNVDVDVDSHVVIDLVDEPVIDLRDPAPNDAGVAIGGAAGIEIGVDTESATDATYATEGTTDEEVGANETAGSGRDIDSLFARLKESSAEPEADAEMEGTVDVEPAPLAATPVASSIPDHAPRTEAIDDDSPAAEQSDLESEPADQDRATSEHSTDDESAPRDQDEGQGQDDESAEGQLDHQDRVRVVRRDAMVEVAVRDLSRHLKRLLSDDQNGLLEMLRASSTVSVGDLMVGERPDLLDEVAHAELTTVFTSGASYARPTADAPDATVSDLSRDLADRIDGFLNDRLTRAVEETSGESGELAERVRAVYRELRTREIARASDHAVLSSFARGSRAVAGPGDSMRWVANGCGPDCLDNSLAGSVGSSDEFPTGHSAPPAHEGCRCLLVVVEH